MMMKRTTEQITDISRTASLVGIEQFLLKLGSRRRETRSREDYSEIQGQTRQHSKVINLPRKKHISIYVNKTDCDTACSK